MSALKDIFLLDTHVHFLNHGSFGACPRPVFDVYQSWQRRLERQPVLFLGRQMPDLDRQARQALGATLNAAPDDLAFVTNATHAVNILARSLNLAPGDEILSSDHEYGACDNTWHFICQKTGARYIRQPVRLPVSSRRELMQQFLEGLSPRTRVIYLSHITSATALQFPVEEIIIHARENGILTVIDGAHAPGQIPLDLAALGADFYFGNCHKWMMAPKGAAFLYARPAVQPLVEPLVVSWGYSADAATTQGSRYIDVLAWTGTRDPAAALSVPAAIQFMVEHNWEAVRQYSHSLLIRALQGVQQLTGLDPLYPPDGGFFTQMAVARLPDATDLGDLKTRLYDEFCVEVPLLEWNGRKLVRISIQGYNDTQDVDALLQGLAFLLPRTQRL